MSLRWYKHEISLSCVSSVRRYASGSKTKLDECCTGNSRSEDCLNNDIRPIPPRSSRYGKRKQNILRNRAPISIETYTSIVSRQNASPTTALSTAATGSSSKVTVPSITTNIPSTTANTPDAKAIAPDTAASTPDVKASTPDPAASTPDVKASTLDMPASRPDVPASTPDIPASTPTMVADIPIIEADAPTIVATVSSVAVTTPSIATATSVPSIVSTTGGSRSYLSNTSPPSASATATTNAFPHSRIALIAGASGGGFVVALLVAAILFFWLHTRRSRQQHQRTFDRRMSEPGMIQKQLAQHPNATKGTVLRPSSASCADPSPESSHHVTLQRRTPRTPSRSARSLIQPPTTPSYSSQRPSSSTSSSPSSANSWPLRTMSRSHSHAHSSAHNDSAARLAGATVDLHPYRHYSAEHFHLPESPAGPFNAWKASQPPDDAHVRPEDLWRKSIGIFELETPITPEAYDAATSRKPSLTARPSASRGRSYEHSETDSRKSSVVSDPETVHSNVPAVPVPVMVGGPGPRAWNTHRKSSSSGV